MNNLPHARDGLMLRNTIYFLLSIYFKNNSLIKSNRVFISDSIMKQCFDGDIPAQKIIINTRLISMIDAMDQGLINYPLNTFDTMKHKNPNFDPQSIKFNDLQDIVQFNARRIELEPNIIQELQNEDLIVRETLDQWNELLRQKRERIFTSEQEALFENYMTGTPDIKEPESF